MLEEHTVIDETFLPRLADLLERVDFLRLDAAGKQDKIRKKDELKRLFRNSRAGLVFVTAFLTRGAMVRYLQEISWETEVWGSRSPNPFDPF